MEELVQDLVSALEQTSEQAKLDELWEEMVLGPLQPRRQVRRRRGHKRRCDSSLNGPKHSRCISEASESSLDESFARNHRLGATANVAIAAAASASASVPTNHSDSDDMVARRWPPPSFSSRQLSWPESDSFTENVPGRTLRRRRKVKRMSSDGTVNVQQKFRASGMERRQQTHHHYRHHHRQRSYKKQRLTRVKKRSVAWPRQDKGSGVSGAGGLAEEYWKDKILHRRKKLREAVDENMSECETSSVCSSDPGLFTNDEGRQGDDEQSDWFFENECASAMSAQGFVSNRDSETAPRPAGVDSRREKLGSVTFLQPARPSQRGCHTHVNRLSSAAARCIRKGRRRMPGKDNTGAVYMDKMRSCPQDTCQKELWLPSFGRRDRSQLKPLCPLCMYPPGMLPEGSLPWCSSTLCKSRQPSVHLGWPCAGDVKRRRKTAAVSTTSSAYLTVRKEARPEESDQGCVRAGCTGGEHAAPLPCTSKTHCFIKPGTSFSSHGEHEDD